MKAVSLILSLLLSIVVPCALCGCADSGGKSDAKNSADNNAGSDSQDNVEEGHPTEGPHEGHLVELGDDEYHGEFLHDDDTDTVTVYILDGSAKEQVPIEATEVIVNLKRDGKPAQVKLPAVPDESDPEGKSSRFQLQDKEFSHELDAEGADPRLSVRIDGKSYTGAIEEAHQGHKD